MKAPPAPTRRAFLAAAAAAGGSTLLPACRSVIAPRPPKGPGERLRLGVIGVGGRGAANLQAVRGEDVVALCDVDRERLASAHQQFPEARPLVDFRRLLELPDLDGVVISTPDHTHYPAAMQALRRGLDVYCEKPLTHTVAQARRLRLVAEQNRCVTQMGIQIHANANYRRVVEAIRSDAIGAVQEVHVFVDTDWSAAGLPATAPVPPHLEWDLWLGPAQPRPFSAVYHPMGWRRYWAFGGGATADMACHHMDLPFWALGLGAPSTVRADGPEPDPEGAPRGLTCDYEFPAVAGRPAVRLRWWAGDRAPRELLAVRGLEEWRSGVLFLGERGWLISNYERHRIGPERDFADWEPPAASIPPSPGHHAEWIRCCKQRTLPTCHFGYAGPLTEAVLLANVAYRGARGVHLEWNPARLGFDGAPAGVDELLDAPARSGFGG